MLETTARFSAKSKSNVANGFATNTETSEPTGSGTPATACRAEALAKEGGIICGFSSADSNLISLARRLVTS
jgi:hypothetical protein